MSSTSKIEPNYYSDGESNYDLIDSFNDGPIMTHEELVGFLKGNVIKYITRYKLKNGREDLLKAKQYLHRLECTEYPDGDTDEEF